ncbi:cyclic di-GMP phosphodiesterase Gmr [Ruminiclostridium hungatei]|uniref:Cyclic di-GMP phosphodiesterase Gmr n=1 Tax=Ruminiclostridium hungatei TaxID=48256 RepID=A0A1V4SNP5_RUMHU|nr:EAL domain-containing protein [Ruminiclostridium hungatei]OPX45509.1 cyclic di-GMP phosphodiesterase Gmr [Ruminiclostridium hungatei]
MFNFKPDRITLKITAIYLLIGILWILLSDKVLNFLANDKEMVTIFSLIKGCMYVTITGVILYFLINNSVNQLKETELELKRSCKAFSDANMQLELTNRELEDSRSELEGQYNQTLINQKKIQESEAHYRLISEATNDAIWKEVNGVRSFSDRWYQITGYSAADLEAVEGGWESFVHPDDLLAAKEKMLAHIRDKTPYYFCEYRMKRKDGKYMWIYARGKACFNENGELFQLAGSHTDITELKEYEHKLKYLAYHDQLTGLENRFALNERLNYLISQNSNEKYALLYIDIDDFKYVNDSMGHKFGDMLLVKICERLLESRLLNSTIYRIGGDEFIVLVENYAKQENIERFAISILKSFKPRFQVNGINIYTTASIGVSTYPDHGNGIDELLKNADIAVYKAKETGKNRIVFYNTPMNAEIIERAIIEKHLRNALDNKEFELHYQPQLDIKSGKISGFEALLRWNNPELGPVSPLKFIGIAEATHMIVPIGEWVLRQSCKFLRDIEKMGFQGLSIAVNISMIQLLNEDFAHMVIDIIEEAGLNPRQVELEITESILMESYEVIAGKLKLLRARGVKIALDDFGKGYSSLNYLKSLPITTLKIDKSFIDTISNGNKDKSLTDLIVKIGRSMDLCVVAEGVETQEQMDYLVKHKCHRIQGYLFSRPVQQSEIVRKLNEQYYNQNTFQEELAL